MSLLASPSIPIVFSISYYPAFNYLPQVQLFPTNPMSIIFLWSLDFKLLEQWFSTGWGGGGGKFCFPGDIALSGDIFYCHGYEVGVGVLMVFSG